MFGRKRKPERRWTYVTEHDREGGVRIRPYLRREDRENDDAKRMSEAGNLVRDALSRPEGDPFRGALFERAVLLVGPYKVDMLRQSESAQRARRAPPA